jgi:two-component system, NtrC family, response regulator HupR/HoxA
VSGNRKTEDWAVLVVDEDDAERAALAQCLARDYRIIPAVSGAAALRILERDPVDVILSDLRISDVDGLDLLRQARVTQPEAIRIVITDYAEFQDMVRIINEAAIYQFVPRPWHPSHLLLLIRRALESRELARRHRYLSRELKFADAVLQGQNEGMAQLLKQSYSFDKLVFVSEQMMEICNLARRAAESNLPILIQGETGTGKELMARAIHFYSKRRNFPFLVQNCGALPDELLHSELFGHRRGAFTGAISDRLGLFPAADGGTVFLDEISEVSPAFQVSLLRFLQEGEVKPLGAEHTRHCDVRIIVASNRPLKALTAEKVFRQDLYYRLRGVEIELPPLRERVDDIPVLADHLVRRYAESLGRRIPGISHEVIRLFKAYAWPGNVRELDNEVRRMVAMAESGEFLSNKHLSPDLARLAPGDRPDHPFLLHGGGSLKEIVERLEMRLVSESLHRNQWNHSKVARELGLSRVGLANKIKRYGLSQNKNGKPG